MMNRVILIGRLTADPELKYTASGKAVASFTLAVDRRTRNPQTGERETDFIRIVSWEKQAEFAANYLTKGRLTAIEGRLQIRNYVTQDGQKRSIAEVVASSVQGLDKPRDVVAPAVEEPPPPPDDAYLAGDFDDTDPFADQ
ncbi:MAG: single-stranded DNA-binding protein [Abditibacteriales bacterium]|nr:single-stranded DNA-binding protein [Abditibacteriales bacterium]MDW8367043.1 single-stranded DNA-binding protein [Abditibacteriales bacterium]